MNKTTKETLTAALTVIGMLVLITALSWVASIDPRPSFFVISSESKVIPASSVAEHSHMLTFNLKHEESGATGSSSCTATAIGKRTVLTATHCLATPDGVSVEAISLAGVPLEIESSHDDGADHLIVVFKEDIFRTWSNLGSRELFEGDELTFWGYPASLDRQRRRVVVSGIDSMTRDTVGAQAWLLDGMTYRGDSGAALYDSKGRMVGMVSYIRVAGGALASEGLMQFGGALEFRFTRDQLDKVK